MDTLKALIKEVDDDYLTGLSNKGTVKRAYKDLEQEKPVLTWQGKEVEAALGGERCLIRAPLGESSCSCPSRSICRHIITAILCIKQEIGQEGTAAAEKEESGDVKMAKAAEETAAEAGKQEMTKAAPLDEILTIPQAQLKRACGSRGYRQFLAHIRAGDFPAIEESSIVTVMIPWEKAVVKLLSPFAYSTCSCHSKELCSHKAQAALAFQLKKDIISPKELEELQREEISLNEEEIRKVCTLVLEMLSEQISSGLSRQSPEAAESLERLAVIAHRSSLPELESGLRSAASCYQQYFSRSAALRREELFENLLEIYRRAKGLAEAETKEETRLLAGGFRDAYEPAGNLHLVGMGGRSFLSRTGYAGEIYYFLETQQKKWYTWTDVRPTIYEGTRRKISAGSGNIQAPWSLNCSRWELQKLEFELYDAMAASGGRLSVSQRSKGEAVGVRSFAGEEVGQMILWDFEKLLWECFGKGSGSNIRKQRERLAMAGAVRFDETAFDTVEQRFSWAIYDRKGRRLLISLNYTKEEQLTIRLLERLEKRLREHPPKEIVFFGSFYIDGEGRLCMYPIEVFFDEDFGGRKLEQSEETFRKEAPGGRKEVKSQTACALMKQYLDEAEECILDVFASGISSVQEETVSQLMTLSGEGERLGLHQGGRLLEQIGKLLNGKRHQMIFSPEPVILAMDSFYAYIQACREKLSRDMALIAMQDGKAAAGSGK